MVVALGLTIREFLAVIKGGETKKTGKKFYFLPVFLIVAVRQITR